MPLILLLMRHAKSSWDPPGKDDFDRPLAPRGIAAAPVMGSFVRSAGLVPDLVLSSTATRTRETLALVLPELGDPQPEVHLEDDLYLASASDLVRRVREIGIGPRRVMIVGHNPGMHGAALTLTGEGPRKDVAALAAKFPTAALAVISFDTDHWSGIRPAAGRLERFVTPRGLADEA